MNDITPKFWRYKREVKKIYAPDHAPLSQVLSTQQMMTRPEFLRMLSLWNSNTCGWTFAEIVEANENEEAAIEAERIASYDESDPALMQLSEEDQSQRPQEGPGA